MPSAEGDSFLLSFVQDGSQKTFFLKFPGAWMWVFISEDEGYAPLLVPAFRRVVFWRREPGRRNPLRHFLIYLIRPSVAGIVPSEENFGNAGASDPASEPDGRDRAACAVSVVQPQEAISHAVYKHIPVTSRKNSSLL